MIDPYRYKIVEVIAKCRLEPSVREVYVEGATDVAFVRRIVRAAGIADAGVYPIDAVEVGAGVLAARSLENGNRGRVIALAYALADAHVSNAVCVIDRDFDKLLGRQSHELFNLVYTDYSGVELYAFELAVVAALFAAWSVLRSLDPSVILLGLCDALVELFVIRATNVSLALKFTWVNPKRCLSVDADCVVLDHAEFVRRYLEANGGLRQASAFSTELGRLKASVAPDVRLFMRGHDFVALLYWRLHQHCTVTTMPFGSEDELGAALMQCVDETSLLSTALLSGIRRALTGT